MFVRGPVADADAQTVRIGMVLVHRRQPREPGRPGVDVAVAPSQLGFPHPEPEIQHPGHGPARALEELEQELFLRRVEIVRVAGFEDRIPGVLLGVPMAVVIAAAPVRFECRVVSQMFPLGDVAFVALGVGGLYLRVEIVRVVFHALVDVVIVGPRDALRIEESDDLVVPVEGDVDRTHVAIHGGPAKDMVRCIRGKQIAVVVHFLILGPLLGPGSPAFPTFSDGSIAFLVEASSSGKPFNVLPFQGSFSVCDPVLPLVSLAAAHCFVC